MYIYIYIFIDRDIYVHVYTYTYLHIYTYTCLCKYIYMYTYIHMNVYRHVCMHMYRCMRSTYTYIHLHTCIYMYVRMHIYTYIYMAVSCLLPCQEPGLSAGIRQTTCLIFFNNIHREKATCGCYTTKQCLKSSAVHQCCPICNGKKIACGHNKKETNVRSQICHYLSRYPTDNWRLRPPYTK